MTTWLTPALFSLFSFGLWGFFTKLSVDHIDSKTALVYQTLGVMIISLITLCTMSFKVTANAKGVSFGVLTGLAYGVGCLFYFLAASKGKITNVVTLTSLYPMITILLSFLILKEQINLKQVIGVGFALLAIFLMSD